MEIPTRLSSHFRYGYITATMLKFIMVVQVETTIIREMDVVTVRASNGQYPVLSCDSTLSPTIKLFHKLHKAYIGLTSNPLREPNVNKMIRSGTFEHAVESLSLANRDPV